MGFTNETIGISLTRDQLIGLIIDDKKIQTKTVDGKPITLSGSGTYTNEPNYPDEKGLVHIFFTNIDYEGEDLSVKARLVSLDNLTFVGEITYEHYGSLMSE